MMLSNIVNVIYVLVAVSMIALILMQRGAGASAGSGFGGGASATVFGARGSANFLTSATKWLAVVFFTMSLAMAWNASRKAAPETGASELGVMAGHQDAASAKDELPALPSAPESATPAVPMEAAEPAPTDPASEPLPVESPADKAEATPAEIPAEAPVRGSQAG